MIAVAIVAILALIALPSYRAYVVRANRVDAQQNLLRAAQALERFYVTNGNAGYAGATLANLGYTQSPSTGTAIYILSFPDTTLTGISFTIRATPEAGSLNASDGYLEITSTGVKVWQGHTDWSR
ncbi:MAG: type IV pilin protein [Nevskia sp.]